MKTYNWEGVNPDGYFLDKLEPIPSALPSFQKLFQVSATALDRKSGSAGMPRPISYAVFCLKKKKKEQLRGHWREKLDEGQQSEPGHQCGFQQDAVSDRESLIPT